MNKEELRVRYRSMRNSLDPVRKRHLDSQITAKLKVVDFGKINFLHIFLPIEQNNEFDPTAFLLWFRHRYRQSKVVISVSDIHSNKMRHFAYDEGLRLFNNRWGIPEPENLDGLEEIDPKVLDFIFVPLLIADRYGHRIGYGKGYYDRFLRECRVDAVKVGIGYFEPLEVEIPSDAWDIPLDILVTPEHTHYF